MSYRLELNGVDRWLLGVDVVLGLHLLHRQFDVELHRASTGGPFERGGGLQVPHARGGVVNVGVVGLC